MLQSEKRSLVRFLVIYLFSTFILFSMASWIFYLFAKQNIMQQQKEMMKVEATHLVSQLRVLHLSNEKELHYPHNAKIDSAMYDLDKEYIFGTLPSSHTLDEAVEEHTLHYVVKLEPYYLGAAYLLVQKPIDTDAIRQLQKQILFFMLVAGVFFTTLGYFLGRLFVAPMRDAIEQMNQFIQDTTHELNTPISTILTNVELIESFEQTPTHNRELTRIAIASKTLSRIYDDLTYLNLNHHYHREIQHLNLSTLLHERVLYFSQMAEAKLLNITLEIEEACMQNIDKNDALRLIDNLLSNAIKYNKTQGALHIVLSSEKLSIEDTGVGIKRKDLGKILQRFKRANSSEGGFGIGLHIVSQVCESYGFTLDIESVEHQGTKVVVVWEK